MAVLQDEIARLRGILEKRGAGGKRKKREKKIRIGPEGESITEENDDDKAEKQAIMANSNIIAEVTAHADSFLIRNSAFSVPTSCSPPPTWTLA
uniref:Uncharacterized protein n=1 Tax=Parascaris equorum TaxID=6256 RepID=A0A914RD02_PAREQ